MPMPQNTQPLAISQPFPEADPEPIIRFHTVSSGSITVRILNPLVQTGYTNGDLVSLHASATDGSDDISHEIEWWSSKDGELGHGGLVQKILSLGWHVLTARIANPQSSLDTGTDVSYVEASVTVNVDPVSTPEEPPAPDPKQSSRFLGLFAKDSRQGA